MDAVTLLHKQLQNAQETLEGTLGDISEADAHKEPGGRAFKVAANYAHVVCAEDMLVNGLMKNEAPMFATTWAGRTGFSETMPNPTEDLGNFATRHDVWARGLKMNLAQARQYAQAVHQSSLDWLASLKPEDADRPIDLSFYGMPAMPLAMVFTVFVIGHYYSLAGEMSACKGVLGLKGYPF
jgi:hypothetical protein